MNTWNDTTEEIVRNTGDMCVGLSYMHAKSARYYEKVSTWLTITAMVLNSIVASILMFNDFVAKEWLILIAAFISSLELLLLIVIRQTKYDELSGDYQTFATKYKSLESNIRRQLSRYKTYRESPNEYLAWISRSYEELYELSPPLKNWILNKYKIIAKREGMAMPQSITNVSKIHIVTERRENKENRNDDKMSVEKKDMEHLSLACISQSKFSPMENVENTEDIKNITDSIEEVTGSLRQVRSFEPYDDQNMRYEMGRLARHSRTSPRYNNG